MYLPRAAPLLDLLQTTRPELPPLPEELRRHICSYLPEVVDLVRLSMVSKKWRGIARGYETKDRRPIFTDQAGVEEVWPHLPFGKVYGGHGGGMYCVCVDIAGAGGWPGWGSACIIWKPEQNP